MQLLLGSHQRYRSIRLMWSLLILEAIYLCALCVDKNNNKFAMAQICRFSKEKVLGGIRKPIQQYTILPIKSLSFVPSKFFCFLINFKSHQPLSHCLLNQPEQSNPNGPSIIYSSLLMDRLIGFGR